MPIENGETGYEADARAAAESASMAESGGGFGGLWRRKGGPGAAGEATAASSTADEPGSGTEPGDWEVLYRAEQARAEDYLTRWQRASADIANIRRRSEQERQEYVRQANATLISDLLPVLDSFERALALLPEDGAARTWADGVLLVERQLRSMLDRAGLTPIIAEGKPFDPNEHEAIAQEPSEQPEGTVVGELQRGYRLHDRVLRPAMVKVATRN